MKQGAREDAFYAPDDNLPKRKHKPHQEKLVKLSSPEIKKTKPERIVRVDVKKSITEKRTVERKPISTLQPPELSLAKPEPATQNRQPSLEKTKVEPQALISCGKAGTILNSYGFEDVRVSNCGGTVFSFEASLDGQTYAIRFNAVTGDATSVQSQR